MVTNFADFDPGFLFRFTADRFLDRLTLIDETRKRGKHPNAHKRPVGLAKEAFVTIDDKHDGDRVRARKVLRSTRFALALMPPLLLARAATTNAAELISLMPAQLRPRLREDARFKAL